MTCILIIWLAWTLWSFLPFYNNCPPVLAQQSKVTAAGLAVVLAFASPVLMALKLRKFALSAVIWP